MSKPDIVRCVLCCPLCKGKLSLEGKSLRCTEGHCYDISADGYVNLLPPGKASNKKTGDDKAMLRSRSDFLESGAYDPISAHIALLAKENLQKESMTVVDAGSGEGYHSLNILKNLESFGISAEIVGLEASKHGAAFGAKRAKRCGESAFFAAANIFDMPISEKSCDVLVSMFAPVPDDEAMRVLCDDGVLIVCSSGSHHLWQMREVLYGEPRLSPPLDRVPSGFEKVAHSSLSYEFTVSGTLIGALFQMTPFYYRCPKEGREKLLSLDSLTVLCETEYNVYKKANNN